MKIEKNLIKLLLVLSLVIVSLCGTACSDKGDEIPNGPVTPPQEEPQPEDEPSEDGSLKPGDDFYTYINGEWLESLEGANPKDYYGWAKELFTAGDAYLEAVKEEMPEYAILGEDVDKCEETLEQSIQMIVNIVTEIFSDIETKEDALYLAPEERITIW